MKKYKYCSKCGELISGKDIFYSEISEGKWFGETKRKYICFGCLQYIAPGRKWKDGKASVL